MRAHVYGVMNRGFHVGGHSGSTSSLERDGAELSSTGPSWAAHQVLKFNVGAYKAHALYL